MTDKPSIPTKTQPRGAARDSGDTLETPRSGAVGGNPNRALPGAGDPAFGENDA